ncbi:MAG: flagellar biosynthesis protein FlhB [Gaiellaceae bacterium]
MAAENKTEKPTPKRRSEARKKGQAARTQDLAPAIGLLATVGTLALLGPRMLDALKALVSRGLAQAGQPDLATQEGLADAVGWTGGDMIRIVGPIAVVAVVAGVLANVAQVGLKVTPQAAKPDIKKLNPISGIKRIFGLHLLIETAKTVAKASVVGLVVFFAVWPSLPELGALVGLPAGELISRLGRQVISIAIRASIAFFVIAVADFFVQRWRHEKQLKMSVDEVKREGRDADVSPELKGQIRKKQMDGIRQRMLTDVPSADVVITNPTHYAVALRYEGQVASPEVIAKGADLVAKAIRDIAAEHGVPVLSNPPLARALYHEVEVGQQIPEHFFQAVAEVLAFVYRTAGRASERAQAASRALGLGARPLGPGRELAGPRQPSADAAE